MTQLSLLEPAPLPAETPERTRLNANAARVLARLRQGPAMNWELAQIGGLRFGGRIFELNHQGYVITSVPVKGGTWRYALVTDKDQNP